ncbi:MAG: hypothetical protein H7A55_20150 [Verrucomicrobiaceae bacterium]|nr:hypothetical protein [Verrucomicrobiaceae bacterium]
MPATTYIISAQIALIAASAAYVGYNRKPGGADAAAQAASAQQQAARELPPSLPPQPNDTAGEITVPQWPQATFPRYAPAEKLAQNEAQNATASRPMGGRAGDVGRSRNQSLPAARVQDKSSAARVSSSAADEPPTFAPVQDGQGYHITADSATNFDLNAKTVVFSGHVVVESTDFVIKTNRLVVYNGTGGSMSKMVANGAVDFHLVGVPAEQVYRGQSEEAVFEPGKTSSPSWVGPASRAKDANIAPLMPARSCDSSRSHHGSKRQAAPAPALFRERAARRSSPHRLLSRTKRRFSA